MAILIDQRNTDGARSRMASRIGQGCRSRSFPFTGAVFIFSLLSLFAPVLQAQSRDERAVRTAFVFNLTKYVEWPQPTDELVIGFVGDRATGKTLQEMLDGKTSESRPIHVLLNPSGEELKRCNMLYVADSSPPVIRAALGKLADKNILTVGEVDSFVSNGGMIGLIKAGDQIQIQVNLEAAQHSGVKISSRLLNLAVIRRSASGAKN